MNFLHDWGYVSPAVLCVATTTVMTRGSFFMLPAQVELPPRFERALRYAPACALAAIVAPGVFTHDKVLDLSWQNNQMWALLAASAIFAKTRNMLAMMAIGMLVFTALRLWT